MMISTCVFSCISSKLKKWDILIDKVLNKYLSAFIITPNNHHLAFKSNFFHGPACAVVIIYLPLISG